MSDAGKVIRLTIFIDNGMANLRSLGAGAAAAVWLVMLRHQDPESGLVSASLATIAKSYGTDTRSAQRMVEKLIRYGYVTVHRPGSRGRGNITVYQLHSTPVQSPQPVWADNFRLYNGGQC